MEHATPTDRPATRGDLLRAAAVHVLTASGVVCCFLAVRELCRPWPDPRYVFLWLIAQVIIDALDGPFARRWRVKQVLPQIDGRTIDDIVDYLSFTFIPLVLMWRMDWLGPAGGVCVAVAMVASLFGFANKGAKDEEGGFFLGFPSYWNIAAIYAGLLYPYTGPWPLAACVLLLAVASVLPIRFIYPNLAPRPWRKVVLIGAYVWTLQIALLLPSFPNSPAWMLWPSLIYPAFYLGLSAWLDVAARRRERAR